MLLRDGKGLLMLGMRCAGKGCEAVANSGPNTESEELLWLPEADLRLTDWILNWGKGKTVFCTT